MSVNVRGRPDGAEDQQHHSRTLVGDPVTCKLYMSDRATETISGDHKQKQTVVVRSATLPLAPSISHRRGIDLNIPRFNQVAATRPALVLPKQSTRPHTNHDVDRNINESCQQKSGSTHGAQQQLLRSHSLGPLTPPHDVGVRSWSDNSVFRLPVDAEHDSAHQTTSKGEVRGAGKGLSLSGTLPSQSVFQLPAQGSSHLPWLEQALGSINRSSDALSTPQYIEFVSQVLPNHAFDRRSTKTSEKICDYLQQTLRDLQAISITHAIAVPQSQVVEDFPKSPPTTPNFMVANGYFDEPVIVTKAANVAIYHGPPTRVQEPGVLIQRRIMARSIVDVALLERWIPPTTASEITDFFNADSYRSYLADRLSELAVGTGSLLLIYPTRSGGQAFCRKYVAPVLDPLLREMSIMRFLDVEAAQRLGSMDAVDAMIELDEMKSKIEELCTNMSLRTRTLSVRGSYKLVHCQAAEVIMDRTTWVTWFVEQEQQRLKQNLVDYHKDGGRLPHGDGGSSELTAGMLTREIIEGMQKSKNEAGNVGIEVGVFVIQRTKRSN